MKRSRKTWDSSASFFRKTMVAGLLVIVPVYLTLKILQSIVGFFDEMLNVFPDSWRLNFVFHLPGLGLLLSFALVFCVGLLARNYFGSLFFSTLSYFFESIPIVKTLYGLFRQVSEVFLGDKRSGFKEVVLVEWPSQGLWTIAFVASARSTRFSKLISEAQGREERSAPEFVNLFVPATPNPTSGFYFIAEKGKLITLDISVEKAFKIVISAGAISD